MDKSTHAQLLDEIEAFLKRHDMPPTTFGQKVANDVRLVSDLRKGRDIRLSMLDDIRVFMAGFDNPKRPNRRRVVYESAA